MSVTVEASTLIFGLTGVTATLYLGDTVDTAGIAAPESTVRKGVYQFLADKTTGIYGVALFAQSAILPFAEGWIDFSAGSPYVCVSNYPGVNGGSTSIPPLNPIGN